MDREKRNKKDYGISLLRIILSFMVVIDHFLNSKLKKEI